MKGQKFYTKTLTYNLEITSPRWEKCTFVRHSLGTPLLLTSGDSPLSLPSRSRSAPINSTSAEPLKEHRCRHSSPSKVTL